MGKLLQIRCNDSDYDEIKKNAGRNGMTVSAWLRFRGLSRFDARNGQREEIPVSTEEALPLKVKPSIKKTGSGEPVGKGTSVAVVDDDPLPKPLKGEHYGEHYIEYDAKVTAWMKRDLNGRFKIARKAIEDYRRSRAWEK